MPSTLWVKKHAITLPWGTKIRKRTKSSFSQMICLLDRILGYIIWDGDGLQYKENTAFSKKLQPERWCGPRHSDIAAATPLPACGGTYDNLKCTDVTVSSLSIWELIRVTEPHFACKQLFIWAGRKMEISCFQWLLNTITCTACKTSNTCLSLGQLNALDMGE